MLSWGEFAEEAPDLAERGQRLLRIGYAFIATTARDGSPRVHPATPLINGGRLFVFVAKHTVKYGNLMRDPRYAMHAVLGESDEEFLIHGTVVPADDPESDALAWEAARAIGMTSKNHRLLEFRVAMAHWAVWHGLGTQDIRRETRRWPEK